MRTDFSLWRKKALPDSVEVDGRAYPINGDFRVILKCFAILNDPDVLDGTKAALVRKNFFPNEVPDDWFCAFDSFVRMGKERKAESGEAQFDYEFDAPEILSSFQMLYGIDLLTAEIHWWRFSILLDGCFRSDCPLSEKIRLRSIKPEKCEDPAAAREAKASVQIPSRIGQDAMIEQELLMRRLRGE